MRATRLAIPAVLALLLAVVSPATAAGEDDYPVPWHFGPAIAAQLADPDSPAPTTGPAPRAAPTPTR
ncbi:MAG: hypothetical protein ACRDQ7_22135 [Haloechinothrix sp.]